MNFWSWLGRWKITVEEFSDTVMMKRQILHQSLMKWLPKNTSSDLTLLVCHFPSTFIALQEQLSQSEIDYQVVTHRINHPWICGELEKKMQAARPPALSRREVETPKTVSHGKEGIGSQTRNREVSEVSLAPVILVLVGQLEPLPAMDKQQPKAMKQKAASRTLLESAATKTIRGGRLAVLSAERHFLRSYDLKVADFVYALPCRCQIGFFVAMDDLLLRMFHTQMLLLLLEHYGMVDSEPLQSHLISRQISRMQKKIAQTVQAERPTDSPHQWLQINCPQLMPK